MGVIFFLMLAVGAAILCWPLALMLLLLLVILWLITLPFRLAFICVEAALALVKALLFLPARLLGWRKSGAGAPCRSC